MDETEPLPPAERTFDVAIAAHALRPEVLTGVVAQGCTLREMGAGGAVLAFIDGQPIHDLDLAPRAGQMVLLKVVPQGGGNSLRLIASIAIIAVAALAAPYAAPYLTAFGAQAGTVAFAGLTLVGQLALTALIPPPSLNLDRAQSLQPFRGVQRTNNRIAPFEVVPRLYGKHRLYPAYAALPVPVSRGGRQDFLGLYCVGYRDMLIDETSFKIGETPFLNELGEPNFAGLEYRIWDYTQNEALDEVFQIGAVTNDDPGDLKQVPAVVTRFTEDNTSRVEIEVGGGPLGVWQSDGDMFAIVVGFKVEFRVAGSGGAFTVAQPTFVAGDGGTSPDYPNQLNGATWDFPGPPVGSPGAFVFGDPREQRTYTVSVAVTFPSPGQYEVRITRLSANGVRNFQAGFPGGSTYDLVLAGNSDQFGTRQQLNLIRLISIVAGTGGNPTAEIDPRFAYVALKLRASDQLNGAVDDFNLVATGVVPVWNGSAFVMQASSTPAWAYRDVLLGSANGRPISADKVDDATLIAWATSTNAEVPPREFNGSFDGLTSVFEALKAIASAGRAAFSMRDGKYSIVRDVAGKTPVQLFTPRNNWEFSARKTYTRLPHALKIKFLDRDAGWIESERVVYADGYSRDGAGGTLVATLFEQLSPFGCTHKDQVFKDGRYVQAVAKLRPETFSWQADIEHLVCQRGDVVRIQHDAILVGLGAGRITALTAGSITLDERALIEAGPTYQVRIRRDDGSSVLQTITNAPGEANTLTLSGGVSGGVKVGDLVAFGESGLVTLDVLIIAIDPQQDLRARITAVPYSSPAVHTADAGAIPAYDPMVTPIQYAPPPPLIVNIDSSAEVGVRNSDGTYRPRIFVSYSFPASEAIIKGVEFQLRVSGAVNWSGRGLEANNGSAYLDVVDDAGTYDLRLRGQNDRGTPGPWTEVFGYVLETRRVAGTLLLALVEQRNNPATPNRDLSTVVATVTPPTPADPTYSRAFIDFRRPTDAAWTAIGPTDANHQARVTLNSDGTLYEFRARAVNTSELITDLGTTAQITLSNEAGAVPVGDPDAGATANAALNVANLRVLGQLAAVTTFTGADASIEWNAVVPPVGQTLRDYRVRVINPVGGAVIRVRYVVGTRFTYFLAENQADLAGVPSRSLTFEVVARTKQGSISASAASKTISNPAPALPGDFTHSANENTIVLRFTRPTDGDYLKARVYLSATNGFTAGAGNLVYDGPETNPIVIRALTNNAALAYTTAYYYRVELYDQFGAGALSAQFTATTTDIPGKDTVAPTAPGTPTLSSAVQNAQLYTVSRLTASWTASTDANPFFYEVEVWRTAEPTNKVIYRTADPALTVSPAQAGAGYSVRVRALDYSGNASAFSATATHTVAGDTTAPANVTGATATGGLDKIVVEWVHPADADFLSVLVYRGTTAGFTANAGSLVTETRSTTYVDSMVEFGTSYYYKFATKDAAGNTSAPSAASIGPATSTQITSANVGSFIAAAAVQAAQVGFDIGGGNLVTNSSFEADSDANGTADSWAQYNNSAGLEPTTLTRPTTGGVFDGAYQRVTWAVNNTTTKGLHQSNAARGGWEPNETYVTSWYARATGTNVGKTMTTNWNTAPTTATLKNPPLSAAWQRYAFRVAWGASVEGLGRVYFGIANNSGSQGTLDFACVQIEKGDVLTAYAPRPDEILPSTITATEIADNAVTAPKIIAGAIVAGKIAADAVQAGNIAANAVTTRELTVGDFTNLLENSDFENGDFSWTKGGGWAIVNDPANAFSGNWVARSLSVASAQALTNAQSVVCQAGDVFYATARIKTSAGAGGGQVRIIFRNAAGTAIQVATGNNVVGTSYAVSSATSTCPALGVTCTFDVLANTGGNVYCDAVQRFRVNGTALIQDAAIITAKIENLAVTNAKIDNLAVTNAKINDLDAVKITAGSIAAARIAAGTITADKLNVTQLSAIAADLGTITAGTITSATFQTAASGARVVIDGANGIVGRNASNVATSHIRTDGSGWLGVNPGNIQWTTAGAVTIAGNLAVTGTLAMSSGAIYGGKTTYASTTAGYWLGFDAGAAKFKIGNATKSLDWDGSALTVTGVIRTAASGQRVVLTSGNETEFYDSENTLVGSIGVKAAGADTAHILGGVAFSGTAPAGAWGARIGVAGYSKSKWGVFGRSQTNFGGLFSSEANVGAKGSSDSFAGLAGESETGIGVEGQVNSAASAGGTGTGGLFLGAAGIGVLGSGGNTGTGTAGIGLYGGVFQQINNTGGGSILLKPESSITTAPTHTAESGTLCVRYISGVAKVYIQTAGGFGGTGSTWVVLGSQT